MKVDVDPSFVRASAAASESCSGDVAETSSERELGRDKRAAESSSARALADSDIDD